MWDKRYAGETYAYGTQPNDFLRDNAQSLPVGDTLCLGEGEGRNAVFLAGLGHRVTALDSSEVGLGKALRLAAALRPGGRFILEAYTPDQLRHGTGGPANEAMMMDVATLHDELAGLEFQIAREVVRDLHEGEFHNGIGAVVQLVARKG